MLGRILIFVFFLYASFQETSIKPCVVHTESLQYPRIAWQARIDGIVKVKIHISAEGKVLSASATSGHRVLQDAAENNVKRWEFARGHEQDIDVVYEFRLEEPEVNFKQETRTTFDLPYRVLVVTNLCAPNTTQD